ncbi:MAG: hypothetical protein HGB14_02370, partial [Anaerolineaceae bacterium]|nr:hypothetical protein [Anaerolineaceae bacterium]
MLTHLGLTPSFGFGDRLGLATPGHIAAVQGTDFAPIFAQQSVRENDRTGRTPLQVMNDAKRAVDEVGWKGPWGADADHLKTLEDLPPFVDAGYTFFTIDPGKYVDNDADSDSLQILQRKFRISERKDVGWDQLSAIYLSHNQVFDFGRFDDETLLRPVPTRTPDDSRRWPRATRSVIDRRTRSSTSRSRRLDSPRRR